MLQQTQVSRVIPYFERMIAKYPTVQDLAATTWDEFLPYYQGLGYYSRGRNMLKAAQTVMEQFDGEFPQSIEELRKLPGVGPYTAAAILSFGYGKPHLAFDTNHQRVWGRVLHGNKKAPVNVTEIEANIPRNTPFQDLNAALMDFANTVCLSKSPQCEICPLAQHCRYFQTSGSLEPTTSRKKSTFLSAQAQTVLVLHRQHKEYFSMNEEISAYQPFILPAPVNTRERIKEYFARKYGLNIAVRPAHWKGSWQDQPTQVINAQILLGDHVFTSHSPAAFEMWWNTFSESAEMHQ